MRTDPVWDGITRSENPNNHGMQIRQQLADCTKRYDWPRALAFLAKHPKLVNATRPGGRSLYAPLHQAAHGGAPVEVVGEMLKIGAWRTMQNARGERPIDVARKRAHYHLIPILEPQLKQDVPLGILLKLQSHFHRVIRGRADHLVEERSLRLPELEPLLEMEKNIVVWFAIPGMYGGFAYRLERDGVDPRLIAESWCRVVGGSGQRHEVTSAGSKLVAEGFV